MAEEAPANVSLKTIYDSAIQLYVKNNEFFLYLLHCFIYYL